MDISRENKKEGIALVIVLGLLSLLVLVTVSFLIIMRTERKGANNYMRMVQTRQMTLAALDQAIADISLAGWAGEAFTPTTLWSTNSTDVTLYTLTNSINLTDVKTGGEFFVNDAVIVGGPPELKWSELISLNNSSDYGCLYAYIIMNDSGKIDINHLLSNINFEELNVSVISNSSMFAADALSKVHLYNNAEIAGALGSTSLKRYFTSYNKFGQKILDGSGTNYVFGRVLVSYTNESGYIANKSNITNYLGQSGITNTAFVFTNLLDYVDSNFSSHFGWQGYGSEPVPMINEVACDVVVTRSGVATIRNDIDVSIYVEIWNPYENITTHSDTLVWSNFNINSSLGIPFANVSADTLITTNSPLNFQPLQREDRGTVTYPAISPLISLGDLDITVQPLIIGVDWIPPLSFSLTNLSTAAGSYSFSYQIDDPRLNYDTNEWDYFSGNTIASGVSGMNSNCTAAKELPVVAGNRQLKNVGELGFLTLDAHPWQTIEIVGANSNILDYFTVYTNEYQHGLVNINNCEVNTLNAAFDNTNITFSIPSKAERNSYATDLVGGTKQLRKRTQALGVITNERLWAACSDNIDVYGQAFTVLLMVKTFKDNTLTTDTSPNGVYDGPLIDPTLGRQFLVAQLWRDPVTREVDVTFLKWQRRND